MRMLRASLRTWLLATVGCAARTTCAARESRPATGSPDKLLRHGHIYREGRKLWTHPSECSWGASRSTEVTSQRAATATPAACWSRQLGTTDLAGLWS